MSFGLMEHLYSIMISLVSIVINLLYRTKIYHFLNLSSGIGCEAEEGGLIPTINKLSLLLRAATN